MKTILDLDAELLARAKSLAARENTSVERLMEEGLRLRLDPQGQGVNRLPFRGEAAIAHLPVFMGKSGLSAAVKDPASHQSLLDVAENAGTDMPDQNGI